MPLALELAWHELRRRPGRSVAPVVVAAAATLTVLVTTAFYLGMLDATVAWLRTLPGDAVVVSADGTSALMTVYSYLPPAGVKAVRAVEGVARVEALYGDRMWLRYGKRDAWVQMLGVPPRGRFGLPLRMRAGAALPRKPRSARTETARVVRQPRRSRAPHRHPGAQRA